MMRKILLWALAIAGLAATLLFALRAPIAMRIYGAGAERAMAGSALDDLPDGLHVAFCGTGSPMPDPHRSGPCTAVIVGTGKAARIHIVDSGDGAARMLQRMRLPPGRISMVLLTHFHSDHIDGLGALAMQRWVGSAATRPMLLVGPTGVEQIAAGFNAAYRQDATYRTVHHGSAVAPPAGGGIAARAFAVPAGSAVLYDSDGLKITAIRVDHGPVEPAVGYRFDYKGRSVVISGDTKRSASLHAAAQGADLLVHEALQPRLTRVLGAAATRTGQPNLAKILTDIENYHSTPEEVADLAAEAGVKAVALTHIVPPLRLRALQGPFLGDARQRFDGPLDIMADGDLISLSAEGGSTDRNLLEGW